MPNSKSNFPINDINVTLGATQASLIATYRIGESSPLGVVSYLAMVRQISRRFMLISGRLITQLVFGLCRSLTESS